MLIILLVLIGAVIAVVFIYNDLVRVKIRVKEAYSAIDIQLKRRADLIPNLVETVKGYAKHEKTIFENVTKERARMLAADGPHEKAKSLGDFEKALKSLFAVAENYPTLAASANFIQLQKELADTEDKVAYSRQFYNSCVLEYNTKIEVFPTNIAANMLGYKKEEFFDTEEESKKEVNVNF